MLRRPYLIVAGILLAGFALLADAAQGVSVLPGDIRFTRWVQGLDWPGLGVFTEATNRGMNGAPLTLVAVAVAIGLLVRGLRRDAALLIVLVGLRLINGWMKELYESPRPPTEFIRESARSLAFGFPSGHSSGALLVIGCLAWIFARRTGSRPAQTAIWVVAILVILTTGIGRIRVGAHWPSDVLGAWLWATAALIILIGVSKRLSFAASRLDL